jgi:hypothetical protein
MNTRFQREEKKILKYYKIFILSKDDYFFIIEKRKLYKSIFFKNMFFCDKLAGNINSPIFLQKKNSLHIKHVFEYLKYYYNKTDYFYPIDDITINSLDHYLNDFDISFFMRYQKQTIEEYEDFFNEISYFNVKSLNEKWKLFLFFQKNKLENKLENQVHN